MPEPQKIKSPSMTFVLPGKALHPHLPPRLQRQLDLHRRNRRKTEGKMPSNGVSVDPILLHVIEECGEIREIILSASRLDTI